MMLFTLCFAVVVFDLLFFRSCAPCWDVLFVLCAFSDREDLELVLCGLFHVCYFF